MDQSGPITLFNPNKYIFTPKNSYTFPKKQTFQRKNFSRSFERTDHLAQLPNPARKEKFLLKKILILTRKQIVILFRKKFLRLSQKNKFSKRK